MSFLTPAGAGSHLGHNFWNENDREISIRHLADSDVLIVTFSEYNVIYNFAYKPKCPQPCFRAQVVTWLVVKGHNLLTNDR